MPIFRTFFGQSGVWRMDSYRIWRVSGPQLVYGITKYMDALGLGRNNTQFFHASTLVRRHANTILRLQDDDGEWSDNPKDLQRMVVEFFSSLFNSADVVAGTYHLRGLFPVLDQGTLHALGREIVDDEIKAVIFSMGPLKALDLMVFT
ncbi:hypothetical protein V6N13_007904 [Hibiscus sabdariffa]